MTAWRRLRAASPADRRLLGEAAAQLMLVGIALRIVRFHVLRRWLGVRSAGPGALPPPPLRPRASDLSGRTGLARIGWAVEAAGRRVPGATCLVQALAADAMLRRRGYRPALRFGVRERRLASRPIDAHAWVEVQGAVVVGGMADLADYAVLAPPEVP